MTRFEHSLTRVIEGAYSDRDLLTLLSADDPADRQQLFAAAYAMKRAWVGSKVYFRALIELSNVCCRDCLYCGIRRSNTDVDRYLMTPGEVMEGVQWADAFRYGSLVLQAGERRDTLFIDYVEDLVRGIKAQTEGRLGITLSLGEQTPETYARWRAAGAHRYLLRIETANPELYSTIHADDQPFADRLSCLQSLQDAGYQVGTGVMIGLPGQTLEDLVRDVRFFQQMDVDMIGMGPYLPAGGTPLGTCDEDFVPRTRLDLGLRMIAVTRLVLKDVNIASTTALQALEDDGREQGLKAGANVIMPNVSDTRYRSSYQLYDNKPCLDENAAQCRGCLSSRISKIGETIGFGEWGDSPHYRNRMPASGEVAS